MNRVLTAMAFVLFLAMTLSAQAIIIDHTCTRLDQVPENWITQAKANLRVTYGHTSHGSQLVTGISAMRGDSGSLLYYTSSSYGYHAEVFLNDSGLPGASDLGNPDRTTWAQATRNLLDREGGCNRNVVLWSWCGQADTTPENITTYLSLMNALEQDYPSIRFIYMTGHLNGGGADGNLNLRNEQIRQYCRDNGKILFDFADIESYDPDGTTPYMPLMCTDNCDYDSDGNGSRDRNWAEDWIAANPGSELTALAASCGSCAHSQRLNCILKGRAFWWLMARLAGWDGSTGASLTLTAPNGGEHWRCGETRAITWTATGLSGTLTLELLRNGSVLGTIATGLSPAAGTWTWTVGALSDGSRVTGGNLVVRLRSADGLSLAVRAL